MPHFITEHVQVYMCICYNAHTSMPLELGKRGVSGVGDNECEGERWRGQHMVDVEWHAAPRCHTESD